MPMGRSRYGIGAAMLRLRMSFILTHPTADGRSVDRRRFSRLRPSYLRFYSPVPGVIVDLSRDGMAIKTTGQMPVGKAVRFRVRHHSRLFSLSGVVRHCEIAAHKGSSAGASPAMYRLGIEFAEPLSVEGLEYMAGTEEPADR